LIGNIAKTSLFTVEKKLCRLCVTHIAADISDRLVDVPVGGGKIEPAVEIDVEKCAPESQAVFRGQADTGLGGNILEAFAHAPVEANHFVVKVGDDDTGRA
jgi:hypothetical protein